MAPRARYEPCMLLRRRGIPCVVWFEDAVAHHGVPAVVSDLYVLVPDIEEAARALESEGWTNGATTDGLQQSYHLLREHPSLSHRCLVPTDATTVDMSVFRPRGPATTILLPANDWNVATEDLRLSSSLDSDAPQLTVLVDALIESLLDSAPDCHLRRHLLVQVCYLYGSCKELRREDFAAYLRPENRQFHYDAIAKPGLGTAPFIAHQRRIRDEWRSNKREPQHKD